MKRFLLSILGISVLAMTVGVFGMKSNAAEAAPPGAAWNVGAQAINCNTANVNWQPSGQGVQQWVDYSHWNGWYWEWQNKGPMGTFQASTQLNNLQPNTTYWVRINTGTWYGDWLPSDWTAFTTPNCQVQAHCGNIYYILPGNPAPLSNQVCVDQGTGSNYNNGQFIKFCYDVSAPRYIKVVQYGPGGAVSTLFDGYDDGTGDCKTGATSNVDGRRDVYLFDQWGGTLASTYYFVN